MTSLVGVLLLAGPSARAQFQYTACVEHPSGPFASVSTGASDCDPRVAVDKARKAVRQLADGMVWGDCVEALDEDTVADICLAASGVVPLPLPSIPAAVYPASGASKIDAVVAGHQITPASCTAVRYDHQTSSSHYNAFCFLNGFQETHVSIGAFGVCGVQCSDVHLHPLQVRPFIEVDLSRADADARIAEASALLQSVDGNADVDCAVTLSRLGPFTKFNVGDGTIGTAIELAAIQNLSGNIKVVEAIDFCGGAFSPGARICAESPGNSFLVENLPDDVAAVAWAHGFGHNKGLPDRRSSLAVMHPTLDADNRVVSSSECNTLRDSTALARASTLASREESDSARVERSKTSAFDFVHRMHLHGLPYAEATAFGPEEALQVRTLFDDPFEQRSWRNAALLLGMAGDERAVSVLIEFIADGNGKLTREHHRAKAMAVVALGYLANRTGSERAMRYLAEGLRPEAWAERGDEADDGLARYAAIGLALSGRPEALPALSQQRARALSEGDSPSRLAGVLAQAVEEHGKVAALGLARYSQRAE